MQNNNKSNPQDLKSRIYRSPDVGHKQLAPLNSHSILNQTSPELRGGQKLVPKISRKKLESLTDEKQKNIVYVGPYALGVTKQHKAAGMFINEKTDEAVVSDQLPKYLNNGQMPINVNPNAVSAITEAQKKKQEEASLEHKKNIIENFRKPKNHEKPGQNQDEHLSPFDFIALLRTDPDMADEFCYLNKSDNSYDWVIVDFENRKPEEYMTISSRGITHFLEDEATFLTIEEWEREVSMYHRLKNIPFFKDYKIWKNFTVWKHLFRKNMMRDRSQLLNQDLFFLDRHLNSALLWIRKLCTEDMATIDIFKTGFDDPRTLEEFIKEQEEFKSKKLSHLEGMEAAIRDTIERSCNTSMQAFKEENRIQNRNDTNEGDEPPPLLVGDETNKEMPYTQEATIRTHQRKLRKFIKLIDYLVLEAKMRMLTYSTENLVQALQLYNKAGKEKVAKTAERTAKAGQPMLIIEAWFSGVDVTYHPSSRKLVRLFEDIVNKGITLICSKHKQFLHEGDFAVYAKSGDFNEDPSEELINMHVLIKNHKEQNELMDRVKEELEVAFGYVSQKSANLTSRLEIYKEHQNIDIETYAQRDIEETRQALNRFDNEHKELQKPKERSDIGMYRLDKKRLLDTIRDCAKKSKDKLEARLPQLNYERAKELSERVDKLTDKLGNNLVNVDEFVVFVRDLNETIAQQDEISAKVNEINDMIILVEERKIKIREDFKSEPMNAVRGAKKLDQRVKQAEDSQNASINRFRAELSKDISLIPSKIDEIRNQLADTRLSDVNSVIEDVVEFLAEVEKKVVELKENGRKYNIYQDELQMEVTPFINIEDLMKEFQINKKLWTSRNEWKTALTRWRSTQFLELNVEEMATTLEKIAKAAMICAKELEINEVAKLFKSEVDEFKAVVDIVVSLRGDALKQETHWEEIRHLIDRDNVPESLFTNRQDEKLTFQTIVDLHLDEYKNKLGDIAIRAIKEKELEKMLLNVQAFWSAAYLTITPYKDKMDFYILGNNEELITKLDDSLETISSILSSRYVEGIRGKVEKEKEDLRYFQELLDAWMLCQKNWMYLEPIFNSADIQKQLASEYKRFHNVENQWKSTMKNALMKRSASHWAHNEKNQLQSFRKDNENLEKVQKALEDYLENKRGDFPRFFFLSNDELLEILSQAKDPQNIQPHLRKCFENINKLEFEGGTVVSAMISAEGERVELKNLKASTNVEQWLKELEKFMQDTLKAKMEKALEALNRDDAPAKKEWVKQHHSQLILAVDSIEWTRITEEYLQSENAIDDMEKWHESVIAQLQDLTELIRGELTVIERRTIVALVTQDVHYRDIVEQLKNDQVDNPHDFKWQQQLRFYFRNKICEARQVNATLPYGYEYLGAPTRLVITPLTDRCWMTITGALNIKLGAAPAGPAGTGKTESVKDLAKALGRLCVVFNCSEQITVRMMEKLFMGLCATDSWACLDEFNRINIEVLSVIAQQVRLIKDALHVLRGDDSDHVEFGSRRARLRPNMGIFITMNPGYAGRTELPDNLKVLFRPVSMMVPDYALIAEIMLYAEGFSDAKDLSRKMTKLYKLASEQLSQQDHYDFGMRAVKSVLVMAGALKRAEPKLSEDIVLIRAMRDSNVPKFLSHDLPLFNAIISDLFPDVEIPNSENAVLINQIQEEIVSQNLPIVETFVEKVIQYHETLKVRFGVMLVGPSMSGKSTVLKTLKNAYTNLKLKGVDNPEFQVVEMETLNPKAISMGELYGDFDNFTLEWTDGLAARIMREYASKESPEKKWVMFDGPVDALWIENMNTVLDDNMTLCLSNGQRIKLKWQMRMLFEVQDLAVASPATVSRCGMVYIDNFVVGSENVLKNYIDNILGPLLSEEGLEQISKLFMLHFAKTAAHIRKNFTELIATVDNNLALSIVKVIEIFLRKGEFKPASLNTEAVKRALDKIFVFAFAWGIGSAINPVYLNKFENFIGTLFQPNDLPRGSVFDSFISYEAKGEGEFKEWSTIMPEFEFTRDKSYFELIVPTKDTVRYSWLLENSIDILNSVFFTGITGVGKTIIMEQTIEKMKATGFIDTLSITFSAQTSALQTQLTIESKLFPSRKDSKITLKPPAGKKLVVFIDDINMPSKEEYGAQPPVEFLRLLQDKKGCYDRVQLFWKDVKDCVLVASAAPPGGGRSDLTPRFTRHFHMMCLPPTQEESLNLIFKSILVGFFKAFGFKGDLANSADSVVSATLDIYNKISAELLPTPAKSHYTFNLRDVSKVFQGILLTKPICVQSTDTLYRLWIHETCRVFFDRLVNDEDREWFKTNIATLLFLHFKVDWTAKDVFDENSVIFADFMKKGVEMDQRTYEEVKEYPRLVKTISDYMDEETNMKLVLFRDAVEHLCRVARILRLLRGHAMLVGLGGSGKKAITKLASVLAGAGDPVMIEPKKGYKEDTFRQDLFEKMMYKAGVEGKTITFLLPDTHIIKESFLEDINNLLNSGEVPNLLKKDDADKLRATMMDVMKEEGVSNKDAYAYFVERVRSNLHIVLAMSPVGEKLRNRLRMFPSLVNCCTIDWINPWPEDALLSVAKMSLETLEFEGITPELKNSLAQLCMFSHITIEQEADRFFKMLKRKVYTTPKGYIDLINSYLQLLQEKYTELNSYKNRLASGLTKLSETNEIVKSLEENLTKLKPVLKEKSIEQEALIQKIKVDRVDADKVKDVVGAEEKIVNDKALKIKGMKDDADKILNEAVPILNGAKEALNQLNRQELAEVKGNQNALIKFMWSCASILLYNKDDDDTIRKMLADASLIGKMLGLDYDHIPEDIQKKIKKKLQSNPEFTIDNVASKQSSAKSIAKWIKAVSDYTDIAKEVESKSKYVSEMSGQLNQAMTALKSKQDELAIVMKKVTDLETTLHDSIKEKDRLEHEKQLTEDRLERAGKLTTGLADEQVRWKEKVEELKDDVRKLIGDVFLSAASVVYYGPFTGSFRSEIVEKWFNKCKELEIPCSDNYSLVKTLGDPVQIRDWNIAGLPSDSVSINNGILVYKTNSWPFMIDPQLQANKWIKNLEQRRGRQLVVIKSSDNIAKTTETCLRMGNPLLIEDMQETLDPALEPLLTKQFNISNGRMMIKIDQSEVEYDPKYFSLYFTTKISNPFFLPEVFIRVSVINFTVTELGLEEQLLADVVSKEMPEKEQIKNELIMSISRNKQSLMESENRILELLSKSQGLVLDDKELVEKLQESKIKSTEVKKNLVEAEETQKNIDEARLKCKPVATRGSILYFVIADLALIDPMYQFSLSYFNRLFNMVIDTSARSEDFDERINILINATTETIYLNVCRGLFNTHKQLFSFLVSSAINRKAGDITAEEWNVFLKGIPLAKSNTPVPALPANTKFSDKSWTALAQTQNAIPNYKEVLQSIVQNPVEWNDWVYSQEPIQVDLPQNFSDVLTIFQKLLLIKLLRTEKSLISMNLYVLKTLGQKFFANVPATMDEVYQDTDQKTPLIFILSPGADPLQNLQRFAREKQMFEKLHTISLGQGQEGPAEEGIKDARKHGEWVLLQNCHLAKSFMPKLERILESLEEVDGSVETNSNFRLFLSSMPCEYFPVSVLQNGVKLTNEPPKGLKANMTRTYNEFSQSKLDECSKGEIWRKQLFSFSLFHAIIQERRKFGPLGWNIRYEFNDSDLETSITMFFNLLEGSQEVPWDAIKFMTGQINYGGRVTDDNDRKCLLAILDLYCGEQILSDDYLFSRSGTYKSPADGNLASYKSFINNFPDLEDPEVFGMHPNANITFEMTESMIAITTILSIQPRDVAGGAGKTPDEVVDALATELESKIPLTIKKEQEDKPQRVGAQPTYIDSLSVCLSQEVDRFNRLLNVMRKTLAELKKAIKGEVVMSLELDKMYQSLFNNQVPQLWQKVSYPSLKNLASWFDDLIKRVAFFSLWLNKGKPRGYWLPAFFFPQGFLTSVLQNYARKYKTPIDILGFAFEFLDFPEIEKVHTQPEDGCYIYGLFVEGCRFDFKHGRLEDSRPGEMFTEAPVIYFNPTENYQPDPYDYSMPVYKTTVRAGTLSTTGHSTNFIIYVDVPTKQKPEYWTLNGAAFICAMNN